MFIINKPTSNDIKHIFVQKVFNTSLSFLGYLGKNVLGADPLSSYWIKGNQLSGMGKKYFKGSLAPILRVQPLLLDIK